MTERGDRRPFIVGLTGNIGTGKSTVAAMLAALGAHVIDADKVAHEVMRPGTRVHAQIVDLFGPGILTTAGKIDRKRLGAIVFRDPAALRRLEAIVHPATLEVIDRRLAATCADVVVVEAIKLIESGLAEKCDSVWVTTCQQGQQIERIMGARNLSQAAAERRIDSQPPQQEKLAHADIVIDNAGSLSATREQVEAAWKWTIEKTGERRNLMSHFRRFFSEHPRLAAWFVLAAGMVAILVWSARDVELLARQWAALIVATIGLAGLCIWIIGWEEGKDEHDQERAG